jgi:hypothetical protein
VLALSVSWNGHRNRRYPVELRRHSKCRSVGGKLGKTFSAGKERRPLRRAQR